MLARFWIISVWLCFFMPLFGGKPDPLPDEAVVEALECPYLYASVNVMTGQFCEVDHDLTLEGLYPLQIKRGFLFESGPLPEGNWHFNLPNLNSQEQAPKETYFHNHWHQYSYDQKNRLTEVAIVSPNKKDSYSELSLFYPEENVCCLSIPSGGTLEYHFDKENRQLSKVVFPEGGQCHYTYWKHPVGHGHLIKKKENPNGSVLINAYYDLEDCAHYPCPERAPILGKIKWQMESFGIGQTPVITNRFHYGDTFTEVTDALGNKTIYRFANQKRLKSVENYNERGECCRIERFYWNKTACLAKDFLLGRSVEDGEGTLLLFHQFSYNEYGELVAHTLWGNLSGICSIPLVLGEDETPLANGVESYTVNYSYDTINKHRHLTKRKEQNGHTTYYQWDPKSHRMVGKLIGDETSILQRHFYAYNEMGQLIRTSVDDGASNHASDYAQVTQAITTEYSFRQEAPAKGLPELVDTYCFDGQTGERCLVKRIVHVYGEDGRLIQQDEFDQENTLRFSLQKSYDSQGNVVRAYTSTGIETLSTYDLEGNTTSIYSSNGKGETTQTLRTFDAAGRLICEETVSPNEGAKAVAFCYDHVNRKTESLDPYGNATRYAYDALGRLTETIYPEALGPQGELYQPKEQKQYNTLNQITSQTDANGYTTETDYNVRGQKTHIRYPDGTEEHFEYGLDGQLKQSVCRKGITTKYYKDTFGHDLLIETLDTCDQLLSATTYTYTGSQITSSTDIDGNTTLLSYTPEGKLASTEQITIDGTTRTEFEYDALGEIARKKEWFGLSPDACSVTEFSRNADNGIEGVSIKNCQGTTLKSIATEDNEEKTPSHREEKNAVNAIGQEVRSQCITDADGSSNETLYDALGRIAERSKYDSFGNLIERTEFFYDGVGNLICRIDTPYYNGSPLKKSCIQCQYGPCNRIEWIDDNGAVKRYLYQENGLLETLIKPDGITLHYTYDALGRLEHTYSSDGTVNDRYSYDLQGNVTLAEDLVHNTTTERVYDQAGRITHETLGNGLFLSRTYDALGRKTSLTLPDASTIGYTYDAAYLRAIDRFNANGELLYTHNYTHYTSMGQLATAELIGTCGSLQFQHDSHGRLSNIFSSHWTESVARTENGKIGVKWVEDRVGTEENAYTYNAQGQLTGDAKRRYNYDSLYRRRAVGKKSYTYNEQHQLLACGNLHFTYDPNGNCIEMRGKSTYHRYTYDALDRMILLEIDGKRRYRYTYDPFNRRISTTLERKQLLTKRWVASQTKRFFYDGDHELGLADAKGAFLQLRVLGVGTGAECGAAVAIELKGKAYAPIHDGYGSVRCLVSPRTGKVVETYRYSSFGEVTIFNPKGEKILRSKLGNPWGFSSKRMEPNTSLLFFGKRFYDVKRGRWLSKDPLGDFDTPNPYAFVRNDPLNTHDLYGLFSISDFWNGAVSCFKTVKNAVNSFLDIFRGSSYGKYVKPTIQDIGEKTVGSIMLYLVGFYGDKPEVGVVGNGEFHDKVRVTLINGMLNARFDYMEIVSNVSEAHGGVNVHYLFRASEGWTDDLLKASLVKMGHTSHYAKNLAKVWKKMIHEMGGVGEGGTIVHYSHSIGGGETRQAQKLLTPEEQKMIEVVTIGSPVLIPNKGFRNVTNYVSKRDIVGLCDPIRYFKAMRNQADNVVLLGTYKGIPFIDHTLRSQTYVDLIERLGQQFVTAHTPFSPTL